MEYNLTKGQALVISGPQGCGKSTLARKIAEKHGSFAEIGAHELKSHFCIGRALIGEPATLIIEGFPDDAESLAYIKSAITNDKIVCNQKHKEPKMVTPPNFIFCSGSSNPINIDAQDRRFMVVNLGNSA